MPDKTRATLTFEESIHRWPDLMEDLNKGGDTASWAKLTMSGLAPAMLFGQDLGKITMSAVISPDEEVLLSVPGFFDDDPTESSQVQAGKVKFNGKARPGVLVVTDRSFAVAHQLKGVLILTLSWPRQSFVALNELVFKFSKVSMTSAGPGYELLCHDNDGTTARLLFRMALTPRRGSPVVDQLRSLLTNPPPDEASGEVETSDVEAGEVAAGAAAAPSGDAPVPASGPAPAEEPAPSLPPPPEEAAAAAAAPADEPSAAPPAVGPDEAEAELSPVTSAGTAAPADDDPTAQIILAPDETPTTDDDTTQMSPPQVPALGRADGHSSDAPADQPAPAPLPVAGQPLLGAPPPTPPAPPSPPGPMPLSSAPDLAALPPGPVAAYYPGACLPPSAGPSFATGPIPPPPSKRRPWLPVVIAVVVVAVLAFGGVAFALRDRLFGGGSDNAAQPGLTVHDADNAPDSGGTFAQGFEESWRYDDALALMTSPDVVIVAPEPTDGSRVPSFVGLDPETGETLWTNRQYEPDWGPGRGCEPELWQGKAVCWEASGWGGAPFSIDVKTGKEQQLHLPHDSTVADWFVSHDILYVIQSSEGDVEGTGIYSTYRLSRWTDFDSPEWTTSFDALGWAPCYDGLDVSGQIDDLVVYCGMVFDAGDGTPLAGDERNLADPELFAGADCPYPTVYAGNHIVCGSGDNFYREITLADGNTATKSSAAQTGALSILGDKPPETWLLWLDNGPVNTATLAAAPWKVGPDLLWTVDLPPEYISVSAAAWDGAHRVLLQGASGGLVLIDISSGTVLWQSTCPYVCYLTDSVFLDDETILLGGYETADVLINASTGAVSERMEYLIMAPGPGPSSPVVATKLYADNPDYVARLIPTARSENADLPDGFPSCPSGMTLVGWTQYPDGLVLVCGSDKGFHVTARHDGADLTPTDLTFTAGGWTVRCKGGTVITVALGGGLVGVTAGGATTTWASQGWLRGDGLVRFSGTTVRNCPSGTVPLSLSTWNGGWLLVCGTDLRNPTWAAWDDDDLGAGTSSDLRTQASGYCATASRVKVCANPAPAVVVFTRDGTPHQRSADANWFTGVGPGGAGLGTGFQGVPTPQDTDTDQVRYLVDILNRSASARASIGPAVDAVLVCNDVAAQIPIIESVAQNRRDLLAALDTTPVDQIPDGTTLVTQLRAALLASLGADEAYLAWAEEMVATGCAVGTDSTHHADGEYYDGQAGTTKETFVATCNSTVAPVYGVPTFTRQQI